MFSRREGRYRQADHTQLHIPGDALSDSCMSEKGRRTGRYRTRLALGSGPTTDRDVSSDLSVWPRSDQENRVTVCIASPDGELLPSPRGLSNVT